MKKVAILLGDGVEPVEAVAPIDVLRRGGVDVTLVACQGNDTVTSAQNIDIVSNSNFKDVDLSSFDMLVIPGGNGGVEVLKGNAHVQAALTQFMEEDRLIGAICAGPTVLNEFGLLAGRKATCYPGCETDFPEGAYVNEIGVVCNNNLITASGPGQALLFGFALLQKLTDTKTAKTVADSMLVSLDFDTFAKEAL